MAKVGTIEAVITAKVEPLRRSLNDATKGFVQFSANVQKSTSHLQTLQDRALQTSQKLKEIGDAADRTAKRATLALAGLVGVMGNAVRMASAQRDAELRLAAAIRGTGQAIDVNKIRAYAAELQNLTTYGDEATIEAAGLLATFQLTENAIVALLPRIQNLSAMYKMDLSQAALQVGRALTQGAGALSRYGITMTEAEKQAYNMATQTEKVAMLLEIFDRNTGDAAQTLAGTGVGAFTQFKNAVGDLNEAIGFLLEQRVADFFQGATQKVQRLTTWFQNLDQDTRDQIVTWVGWTAGILAAVAGISMLVSVLAKLGSALALTARAIAAHPAVFLGAVAVGLALSIDQVREKLMDLAKGIPGIGDAIADMSEEWAALTADLPDVDPSNVDQWVKDAMAGLQAEIAAEGALAGTEWAKAFAKAAASLPGIVGLPGQEFRAPYLFPGIAAGTDFGEAAQFLGIEDATEEQLNAALDLVRDFSSRLQAELNVGRAVAAVIGEPFAEAETKLEATRSLLHALVEEVGMPISSPFAQQLLHWIETLNAGLPKVKEELSDVQRLLQGIQSLMGGAIPAGTVEYDLGVRLIELQNQLESGNVVLAEVARRQIDAAVSAFEEAFLRTADTGQAAAAALVALAGTAPNFRMLDSASLAAADAVEELADATNLSLKAQRAWALRMQGQADAWYASLSLQERFMMALRDAGRAAREFGNALVDMVPGIRQAIEAYRHATRSAAQGGLGLSAAGGIAAAALALLATHSEALSNALDAVAAGLAALLAPIDALLEMLGPKASGALAGAGVGAAAGSLFGPVGTIVGGAIGAIAGMIGGASQKVEEAAQKQIEAAQELVEAARSMTTEGRYGAIAQAQKAVAETEQRLAKTRSQLKSAAVGGTAAGAGLGATAGFLIGGPVGALVGGILGGIIGGGSAKKAAQKELEALQKQLEAQEEALRQIIADFKSALGISVSDLVSSVKSAFSARTVEDFTSQMETSLRRHVRDAMVAAFLESAAMRPLFDALSDAIFEAVRDGVLSAGELDAIEDVISQITDKSAAFFEVLDELGLSMEDLTDTTREVNESLRNVPQGFKIALRRFQVQDPVPMAEGGIVTRPTIALIGEAGPEAVVPLGGDGFGTGVVHVEIHGSIYGVDDLKGVIRQAVAEGNRRTRMATYGLARG